MRTLRLTRAQHDRLHDHLFPGDGLEAVAIALCGRSRCGKRELFTVHRIVPIPHELCERSIDRVTWPTQLLRSLLAEANESGFAVMKIHSHPTGHEGFSNLDDRSDAELFAAVSLKVPGPHLSAIMLPNGRMMARQADTAGASARVDRIAIVGDDLTFFDHAIAASPRAFDKRHRQAFGDLTTDTLQRLSVAVVGVSGTGSPSVEMLVRLGVSRIVLIEPKGVEPRNLNRIYGATMRAARALLNKARMMRNHIARIGLGTKVEIHEGAVWDAEAIALIASCDFVFGCMDSIEGRDVLNRIASHYSLPYIDIGVRLDADGEGSVSNISAAVHYLQPGGSSLKSRKVYTGDELYADFLRRTDPDFYDDQVRRGYIRGVRVERPAVISINTFAASAAVNEFLARLHPYRTVENAEQAITKLLITHGRIKAMSDGLPDPEFTAMVGRGDQVPPLGLAYLARS